MLLSKQLFTSFFPQFNKIKDDAFCEMLNSIGIEVESIHKFEDTKGLVVGEILSVEKHHKSNKLNLCTVYFNNKKHLIVCGADNVQAKKKVIVATINTKMLDGKVIEKKSILGVESSGMICSYGELSNRAEFLSDIDKDNIVILDDNAKIDDQSPLKYIGLDDTIFDLSIPSNRNELNGILSIGYDLLPILDEDNIFDFSIDLKNFKTSKIRIKDTISNFYGLIEVANWEVKESSWKTKYLLMNSGVIPINAIVDISNLNMIISGNPSHSFSRESIDKEIQIENGISENFVGLNNVKYKVEKKDICIVSNNKLLALAGIIGGLDSSIKKTDCKNVVFEIANFNNSYIKKTSDRLSIKTPASIIFSKHIPIWISYKALEIFSTILSEMNCEIVGINYTKPKFIPHEIDFNYSQIIRMLGISISEEKIIGILKSFGFVFSSNKKTIYAPIYRDDIINLNDVIEEILKKININNLEPVPISDSLVNFEFNTEYKNCLYIKSLFLNKGFAQLKTYNLTSPIKNQVFNIFKQKNNIDIINPISQDKSVFRNSIIDKHLEVLKKNLSYKNSLLPTFEIQKLPINDTYNYYLCCVISNDIFYNKIDNSKIMNNLLLLKSLVNDLFLNFKLNISFIKNDYKLSFVKENNSLLIRNNNKTIGIIAELDFTTIKEYDFKNKIFFMELNIEDLIMKKEFEDFVIKEIDNKHPISREISVVISKGKFNEFEKLIKDVDYIKSFDIKNLYECDDDNISYNIEFVLIFKKESPTNEEISLLFNNFIELLEKNNFSIRKLIDKNIK